MAVRSLLALSFFILIICISSLDEDDKTCIDESSRERKGARKLILQEIEETNRMIKLYEKRLTALHNLRKTIFDHDTFDIDNDEFVKFQNSIDLVTLPGKVATQLEDITHHNFGNYFSEKFIERSEAIHMVAIPIQLRGAVVRKALSEGYGNSFEIVCSGFQNGTMNFHDPISDDLLYTYESGHVARLNKLFAPSSSANFIVSLDVNGEVRVHNFTLLFHESRIVGRRLVESKEKALGSGSLKLYVELESKIENLESQELLTVDLIKSTKVDRILLGYKSGLLRMLRREELDGEQIELHHPVTSLDFRLPYIAVSQASNVNFIRISNFNVHSNTCHGAYKQLIVDISYDYLHPQILYAITETGELLTFNSRARAPSSINSKKTSSKDICEILYKTSPPILTNISNDQHESGATFKLGSLKGYILIATRNAIWLYNVTNILNTMPEFILSKKSIDSTGHTTQLQTVVSGSGKAAKVSVVLNGATSEDAFALYGSLLPFYVPERVDYFGMIRIPLMAVVVLFAFVWNLNKRSSRRLDPHSIAKARFGRDYGGFNDEMDAHMEQIMRQSSQVGKRTHVRGKSSSSRRRNRIWE